MRKRQGCELVCQGEAASSLAGTLKASFDNVKLQCRQEQMWAEAGGEDVLVCLGKAGQVWIRAGVW